MKEIGQIPRKLWQFESTSGHRSQALRETVRKLFGVRLSPTRSSSYRNTNIQNNRNLQNRNQVRTIHVNPHAENSVNLGPSLTLDSGICEDQSSKNTCPSILSKA